MTQHWTVGMLLVVRAHAAPTDALVVAGLNATVLTILVAFGVFYVSRLYGALDTYEAAIFDAIDPINRLGRQGHYSVGEGDATTAAGRSALLEEVITLTMGVPTDPKRTPAERGRRIVGHLTALLSTYPFPDRLTGPGGSFVMKSPDVGEPVSLPTIHAARAWMQSLEKLVSGVLWVIATNRANFDSFVEQASAADAEGMPEGTDPHTLSNMGQACLNQVRAAAPIVDATRSAFRRYDLECRRLPTRKAVVAGAIVASLAFAAGVIVPLVDTHAPRLIFVFVPASVYAIIVVGLLWVSLKARVRPDS